MKQHKISIKRKKSFKLKYQKNKFVLFIGEDEGLDDELPLDLEIESLIKIQININLLGLKKTL